MTNRPPTPPAARRRWVFIVAVIGWILIVVTGAGETTDDSLLGVENLHVVGFVFFGVAVLFSIAFLIYLNPFQGEWTAPEENRRGTGVWVLLALVALLWVWQPDILQSLSEDNAVQELEAGFEPEIDTTPDEAAPETVAQATDLVLIALGVGLLGGLWCFLRWRARHGVVEEPALSNRALEADLGQALEEASRELAITGDPRTAVLRSYAVLESVLATHGLVRDTAETPTEHMRRSLQNLRVESAPLIELGALYELARFSDHPITAAQQGDAAQALERARTSLADQI